MPSALRAKFTKKWRACVQAQRAGRAAPDSAQLFPTVWAWKEPGYENVCTEALKEYDAGDGEFSNLKDFPGYFEAGSTLPCMLVDNSSVFINSTAHDFCFLACCCYTGSVAEMCVQMPCLSPALWPSQQPSRPSVHSTTCPNSLPTPP